MFINDDFCPIDICNMETSRNIESRATWWPFNRRSNCILYKTNKEYYEVSTIYECAEQKIDDHDDDI